MAASLAPPVAAGPAAVPLLRRPVAVTVLRAVLLLGGLGFLASYVGVAVARMGTPFDLEWMEGGSVANVRQVLLGHQIYQRPSLGFTPYLYTPLYYYVAAVPARVFGLGYFPLRLVSFTASLGSFLVIGWWVAKETGDRWAGAMGACLLAACYRLGGAWFDLARVDSLFLALLLAGLAAGRFARTPRRAVGAGLLILFAFLTKQEAILPGLALAPFLWRRDRRLARAFLATLVGGVVLSTAVLQWASSGWYLSYVLGLPRAHHLIGREAVGFWTGDMAPVAAALVLGTAGVVTLAWRDRRNPDRSPMATEGPSPAVWFYLPVVGSLLATGWAGRLHSGGYDNVLLPAYAGTAVLFGMGLSVWCAPSPRSLGIVAVRWRSRVVATLVGVAVLVQFGLLTYNPVAQVPTAADARAADQLVGQLRRLPGSLYLPGHPWYAARAGKEPAAQSAAVADVLRGPAGPGRQSLQRDLHLAIVEQRYDNVVTDSVSWLNYLPKDFTRYYRRHHRIAAGRVLMPRTGIRTGPWEVWVPRGDVRHGADRPD